METARKAETAARQEHSWTDKQLNGWTGLDWAVLGWKQQLTRAVLCCRQGGRRKTATRKNLGKLQGKMQLSGATEWLDG